MNYIEAEIGSIIEYWVIYQFSKRKSMDNTSVFLPFTLVLLIPWQGPLLLLFHATVKENPRKIDLTTFIIPFIGVILLQTVYRASCFKIHVAIYQIKLTLKTPRKCHWKTRCSPNWKKMQNMPRRSNINDEHYGYHSTVSHVFFYHSRLLKFSAFHVLFHVNST